MAKKLTKGKRKYLTTMVIEAARRHRAAVDQEARFQTLRIRAAEIARANRYF